MATGNFRLLTAGVNPGLIAVEPNSVGLTTQVARADHRHGHMAPQWELMAWGPVYENTSTSGDCPICRAPIADSAKIRCGREQIAGVLHRTHIVHAICAEMFGAGPAKTDEELAAEAAELEATQTDELLAIAAHLLANG